MPVKALSLHAPPVSITRKMAAALPLLQKMATEKGLKIHHLAAGPSIDTLDQFDRAPRARCLRCYTGYPHPEVCDPVEYTEQKAR